MQCWRHIFEFNEFQQTVLQAQTKLASSDIKQIDTVIKTEDEFLFDQIKENIKEDPPVCNIFSEVEMNAEDDKNDLPLPEVELIDDHHNYQFSSDDEKPLVECIVKTRKKRTKAKNNVSKSKLASDENDEKPVPKKRGRKPKKDTAQNVNTNAEKSETVAEDNKKVQHDENSQADGNASSNGAETDDNQVGRVVKNDNRTRQRSKEIDDFIAQWKQDLECVVCNQTYPNLTVLRKHFRDEHPKQKCYILCCQRKLRHRFHIEEHIRFHIDPTAFKCDECGKCCTTSRNLNSHKLEKHTEEGQQRSFECPICQKRFAKKTVLKCHIETHKTGTDYVCSECGKGFPTEQRRKVHERTVHNVDRVCEQCGKTIHGIYALKQHLLQEHEGVKKPKWPCDICNAQLYSHSSLKRHKQVAHTDGSTVYVCSECGKIAATETALRSHKKYVHQAPRKYKCTICDKAFKVAVVLREHMATHTGEDLYTCPHCPRTFKVSSNMHHHRKKAHPKEWAEGRLNRPIVAKVDVNQVSNEVIL